MVDSIPRRTLTLTALATALVTLGFTASLHAADFAPFTTLTTGTNTDPTAVASGDLNGDNIPDLVVANNATGNVSIFLGQAGNLGTFGAATNVDVGINATASARRPASVVIGDVIGDSNPDIVVAVAGDDRVTVLPGDGTGVFSSVGATNLVTGNEPRSVTLGDADNDTDLDIIVADFNSPGAAPGTVTVWLNDNGADTFTQATNSPFAANGRPFAVKFADADDDGIPDIVVTNFNSTTVSILAGSNDGNFAAPATVTVGNAPHGVAIGDANADGHPDLAVANSGDATVSVVLADTVGGFNPQVTYTVGASPRAVAFVDIDDLSTEIDLVVVSNTANNISVLPGNGTGAFTNASAATDFAAGTAPTSLAIADFDGDGNPDVAVVNEGATSNSASVLINDKQPTPSDDLTLKVINGASNVPLDVLANDTDPDAGDTLTISAVGATDNGGTVTINGTSDGLIYTPVVTDAAENFTYTVEDQFGYPQTANVTVTMATNQAPSFTSSTVTAATEDAVYTYNITATAPEAGDTLTITATTKPTWLTLTDNGDGTATLTGTPTNADVGSNPVTLLVTDAGTLTGTQPFAILVANTNDAPTGIALSSLAINENSANDTVVGTLTTTDPDVGDTFTYSFVAPNSNGGGAFKIVGDQVQVADSSLLNFEAASSIAITVRSTDSGLATFDQNLTITINDVNEAPTAVSLTPSAVDENAANDTVVGTLTSTDPDGAGAFTYSFVAPNSNGGGAFKIVGDQVQVANGSLLNFETGASIAVTVRSTDSGSLTFDQGLSITLNDVNEAPLPVSTIGAQSGQAGVAFGPLDVSGNFSDPEGNNTLTYSLSGLPAGTGLGIDASTAVLSGTLTTADAQASPITVTVSATDGTNTPATQQFTLTVAAANSAPTATAGGIIVFQEDTGSVQVNVSDPDSGDTFTYAITQPGSVGGLASVDANGLVTYDATGALAGSDSVVVTVTDSGTPQLSTTVSIPLTVNATGEVDSNNDGVTDAQAIALGLDPNAVGGDTDGDGIPDANEIGDPANATDTDGDGVIDALEAGATAADASTANGVLLDNGDTVEIIATGQTLSNVSTGPDTGAPAGISFPFGTVSYTTTSAVGGSVTVRMIFSADLPSNMALYKVDNTNAYTELSTSVWTKVNATTVDVTLTDGDPATDLDGIADGSIDDPLAVASVPTTSTSSGGGGGGGCSLLGSEPAKKDPLLPALMLTALVSLFRRKKQAGKR